MQLAEGEEELGVKAFLHNRRQPDSDPKGLASKQAYHFPEIPAGGLPRARLLPHRTHAPRPQPRNIASHKLDVGTSHRQSRRVHEPACGPSGKLREGTAEGVQLHRSLHLQQEEQVHGGAREATRAAAERSPVARGIEVGNAGFSYCFSMGIDSDVFVQLPILNNYGKYEAEVVEEKEGGIIPTLSSEKSTSFSLPVQSIYDQLENDRPKRKTPEMRSHLL